MKISRSCRTSAFCLALATTVAAMGQRTRAAYHSRPTDAGPSSQVGIVGGGYTNLGITAQGRARLDYQPFGGQAIPRSDFGGGPRAGFGLDATPTGYARGSSLYTSGSRAFVSPTAGRFSSEELRGVSFLEQATGMDVPLLGFESPRVELPNRPYFVEPAETTAFEQFFGLSPTRPFTPVPELLKKDPNYSELVEQMNRASSDDQLRRAHAAFLAGTTSTNENRHERLAAALRLYVAVLDHDRTAYVPAVLAAQAALDKGQYELAMHHLLTALKRNAILFSEFPDLTQYYGEPEMIEKTLRPLLRMGTTNPTNATYWAIQAYSAWVLKEAQRTREALDGLEQVNRSNPTDKRLEEFRFALRAAVE